MYASIDSDNFKGEASMSVYVPQGLNVTQQCLSFYHYMSGDEVGELILESEINGERQTIVEFVEYQNTDWLKVGFISIHFPLKFSLNKF